MHSDEYDVLILGSGITGSALALPLRRAGLSVLVVDKTPHPRFAIGEAMVPTTTNGFEQIAKTYDVPEFHQIFNYPGLKEAGCAAYPKTHFFFGVQQEGQPLQEHEQTMFETLELPIGPDVHMLRADVDAFLVSRYPKYGVAYHDHTTLEDHTITDDGVLCSLTGPDGTKSVKAKLVVDATGAKSALARKLGLRKEDPELKTRTRAIFGHFSNVGKLEDVMGRPNPAFRYSRDAGTIHHCFRGGWIWVIPFDNGVTSIGIVLDIDHFPPRDDLSPEEEFWSIVGRFPTVQQQFDSMRPVRPIIRTGRVQYSASSLLSDGILLGPNTGGFIDALYSTGFGVIQAYVLRFVPIAARLVRDPNYHPRRVHEEFRQLDRVYFSELHTVDTIVHGTIESFRSFEVFKQYWRIWTTASLIQFFTRLLGEPQEPSGCGTLFGARLGAWCDVIDQMGELLSSDLDDLSIAIRMKALMDAQPQPFPAHLTNFEIGSDKACLVRLIDRLHADLWLGRLAKLPETSQEMRLARMAPYVAEIAKKAVTLEARYRWSRLRRTDFHKHVDFIRQHLLNRDHPPAGYLQHFKLATGHMTS